MLCQKGNLRLTGDMGKWKIARVISFLKGDGPGQEVSHWDRFSPGMLHWCIVYTSQAQCIVYSILHF